MKNRFSLIKVSPKEIAGCTQIFVPKYESDLEISRKFSLGQLVIGSTTKSAIRNYLFLSKFFAMIKCAYFHMPEQYAGRYKNEDELRKALTAQAGFRTEHISFTGKTFYTVESISFDKMTPERFAEVYSKVFDVVCEYIFSGVQTKEVEEQILSFL